MTIEMPLKMLQEAWARELQRTAINLICSSADDRRNRLNFRAKRILRKRLLLRLLKPNK